MNKIRKTFRFDPAVIEEIEDLRKLYPGLTQTEIIERAVLVIGAAEFSDSARPRALDPAYHYFIQREPK